MTPETVFSHYLEIANLFDNVFMELFCRVLENIIVKKNTHTHTHKMWKKIRTFNYLKGLIYSISLISNVILLIVDWFVPLQLLEDWTVVNFFYYLTWHNKNWFILIIRMTWFGAFWNVLYSDCSYRRWKIS